MPSPDSSNWYDRYLYYLEQALTAAGGVAPTVVDPQTASWYARVEASMMLLAQTLAEGSPGGGSGSVDLSNPGPIGDGTASSATFTQVALNTATGNLFNLLAQSGKPSVVSGRAILFADGSSRFSVLSPGGFSASFNLSGLTNDRVYSLPNQSGTFATTNDFLNATYIGFGESGFPPAAPAQGIRLYSEPSGRLAWRSSDGFIRQILGTLNADRNYTLPNKSGTFAMTDDLGNALQIRGKNIDTPITAETIPEYNGTSIVWVPKSSGGGTPTQSNNAYYTYLQGLSDLQILVGLEDWTGNLVFNRSNNAVGYYSGNFAQQRPSLLSDGNARSALFRTGGILLDGIEVASGSMVNNTIVVRFRADSTARGVLFSYGNTLDFSPSAYDHVVYLNGDSLSVYGFDNSTVQAVNLDSSVNVRDGQPHTLVARFSGVGTDVWLDNVKIIDDPRLIKQNYTGYWRIGHGLIFGSRSSFGGFARGIEMTGFATFSRLLSSSGELQAVHTNA